MSTFGAADVTAYFLNCAYNLPKYRLEEPKMAARIFGPFACLLAFVCAWALALRKHQPIIRGLPSSFPALMGHSPRM